MFAANQKPHDGSSQSSLRNKSKRSLSERKKKEQAPGSSGGQVTLPPIVTEPAFTASPETLFNPAGILESARSDGAEKLPRLTDGNRKAATKNKLRKPRKFSLSIPIRPPDAITSQSLDQKVPSRTRRPAVLKDDGENLANKYPFSGRDVVEMYAKKNTEALNLYYLKQMEGDYYKPYDLRVVNSCEAGAEHFIFSPKTVIHVSGGSYGDVMTLEQWHRESSIWNSLQEIKLFRQFRVQKAFDRWRWNVRKIIFERKRELLDGILLVAVPQYRMGLQLLSGVLVELSETHWLPLHESTPYTLQDFKNMLLAKNQECLQMVLKVTQKRTVILNRVREDIYSIHKELLLHIEYSKRPQKCFIPIHRCLGHQLDLQKQLADVKSVLRKLGSFGMLINHMILQGLLTLFKKDLTNFLNYDFKTLESPFQTELCFDTSGQLAVDPPVRLFQEALSEALLSIRDSICQMCEDCGLFLNKVVGDLNYDFEKDPIHDFLPPSCPTEAEEDEGSDESKDLKRICCWMWMKEEPNVRLVLSKKIGDSVEGDRVHSCYYPITKEQLLWHIGANDLSGQVQLEQAVLMQKAQLDVQQLCRSYSWLSETNVLLQKWNETSASIQPASVYEEHIKAVWEWVERVNTVDSYISNATQLFTINCIHLKENIVEQLNANIVEVQQHIRRQIKQHSKSLKSVLEKLIVDLTAEPQDLEAFSAYARMVKESVRTMPDLKKRLEYIQALRDNLCKKRQMTEDEVTLEQETLAAWTRLVVLMKRANDDVSQRLPSMLGKMKIMFRFLVSDVKRVVSRATSGSFLVPTNNPKEMISELGHMCAQVETMKAELEQLSWNNEKLQGVPLDLSAVTVGCLKVQARKDLWELIASHKSWLQDWKKEMFSKVTIPDVEEKIKAWQRQATELADIISTDDVMLQMILEKMDSLRCQLTVLAKLQDPMLKQKHFRAVFNGMGLASVPEKITVGELLCQRPEVHHYLIMKTCKEAKSEFNIEQTLHSLAKKWKDKLFQLDNFAVPVWHLAEENETREHELGTFTNTHSSLHTSLDDERYIILGLDVLIVEVDHDLMTLSTILESPHSADIRSEVEDWIRLLQELDLLFDLLEQFQTKWTLLKKLFSESTFHVDTTALQKAFKPVDEDFNKLAHRLIGHPRVLHLIDIRMNNERGLELSEILLKDISTMEAIANQISDVENSLCEHYPRLWFLSERELLQLLSFHPTPATLLPFVRRLFQGVQWLNVDCKTCHEESRICSGMCDSFKQMTVLGVYGGLHEHMAFVTFLEPHPNPLEWFAIFEDELKMSLKRLIIQCAAVHRQLAQSISSLKDALLPTGERKRDALPMLDLLSKYPLQCILIAEEAKWREVALQAFKDSNSGCLKNIKEVMLDKLKLLGASIRDRLTEKESELSKYTVMCLRALVLLAMKHVQQLSQLLKVKCDHESSFEWSSFMKYSVNSEEQNAEGHGGQPCYVDVLGHRLHHGYEYFGPNDWLMFHTPSTDRAIIGIVLALTVYRSGFVNGQLMSGKSKTVVHLGKMLGRPVVVMQCCPSQKPRLIHQMLYGALSTGAWLVLDCIDLLTLEIQSTLAQHLHDIHKTFMTFMSGKTQDLAEKKTNVSENADSSDDFNCRMILAGRRLSASLSFGCVLITSKICTLETSQSLRFSTRPVALAHPDLRIIAEVTLTSYGFTEARLLSHYLVSLFSLAKDCLCLPTFLLGDNGGQHVVLRKVISASEKYLRESILEVVSNTSQESVDHNSAVDPEETKELFKWCNSHFSVRQGVIEEMAIVKALVAVLSPLFDSAEAASKFNTIFKDVFPVACQLPLIHKGIEEEENEKLKAAITETLQRMRLHCDEEILCNALKLYQSLKYSHSVMLVGLSGSGKTTCYQALARALNTLVTRGGEYVAEYSSEESNIKSHDSISGSTWSFANITVLYPNALSLEEMFGCYCEVQGWLEGAIVKILRDSERHESANFIMSCTSKIDRRPVVKWLVMDGDSVGHPSWFDCLSTMNNMEKPFYFISSGEILEPSQSHFKLLMEMTDLSDACPSSVAKASVVYFTQTDFWKAVWTSAARNISDEHRIDQGILKMWDSLVEDLFSKTLQLLSKHSISKKARSCKRSSNGMTEVLSFIRILSAFVEHFGNEFKQNEGTKKCQKVTERYEAGTCATGAKMKELFVLAYIWGFGGHLHPRHWPQFDAIARQLLLESRYKFAVPDNGTVFEHFFSFDSDVNPKNTLLTNAVTPKYRKYSFILDLMLEANQPIMLAGEPGSGKTSLCNGLLSFEKPHIRLHANQNLGFRDLRTILNALSCQPPIEETMKDSRMILFVDDLHEVKCDLFGKMSMTLETLRQSISQGEIVTFDGYQFKVLSPGMIQYMSTCRVFELDSEHSSVLSPRLSRLFSIFTLPSLTIDIIFSIHSPRLEHWIKDMPEISNITDMSSCIVNATVDVYHAVCNIFQPTPQTPFCMFSHHDLQKVFQGMCLWQPNAVATIQKKTCIEEYLLPLLNEPDVVELNVVHLWAHECMRTFGDRLCSEDEFKILESLIADTVEKHFRISVVDDLHSVTLNFSLRTSSTVDTLPTVTANNFWLGSDLDGPSVEQVTPLPELSYKSKDSTVTEETQQVQSSVKTTTTDLPHESEIHHQIECVMDKLVFGPRLSVFLNSMHRQNAFEHGCRYQQLDLDDLVKQFSAFMDRSEDASGHITSKYIVHRQRILQLVRILKALVVPGGHGILIGSEHGTGRKTTLRFAADITGCTLIEIDSKNENNLLDVLREAGNQARLDDSHVFIMVHEDVSSSVRDELLVAIADRSYAGPNTDEILSSITRMTAAKNSKRSLLKNWIFERYATQMHGHVHVFLLMPFAMPESRSVSMQTQISRALRLSFLVEVFPPWSHESLVEVATHHLKSTLQKFSAGSLLPSLALSMAEIHQSASRYSSVFLSVQPFCPRTYLEFISHFNFLCQRLHQQQQGQINRISNVMCCLNALSNMAVRYKQDLFKLQEKVAEMQELDKQLSRSVACKTAVYMEAKKKCEHKEVKLRELERKISYRQVEVKNIFYSNQKLLKCLNPADLEEVRHYRDPPDGVVKIMDAICLLFNRPPGWESAKQLLGHPDIFQELEYFDRYSLTNEQLHTLKHIVRSPTFVPETVREVSKACESLCRWVRAVYECCCMQHLMYLKQQVELLAEEAQDQLDMAKRDEENLHRCLQEAKRQSDCVQKALKRLLLELHGVEQIEREAAEVITQLETHYSYWRAQHQEVELNKQCVPGDALILAAIISYLGPFGPDIHRELLVKWKQLCQTGEIDPDPQDPRSSLFRTRDVEPHQRPLGFPIQVSERLEQPLGLVLSMNELQMHNTSYDRLVVKLLFWSCSCEWVQRWYLLANIQHHLKISSQKCIFTEDNASLEEELECNLVVSADDPRLLDKLDNAALTGLRVLVTNVERAEPSPEFLAKLVRPLDSRQPGLKRNIKLSHPKFCLFLSTNLPVTMFKSAIHSSILALVYVVDLSMGSEEIQEVMLSKLLHSQCKNLLIQHLHQQNEKLLLQRKINKEEDSLMDHILHSSPRKLLKNSFLPRLTLSKNVLKRLETEMELNANVLEYHKLLLHAPHQLTQLAAALYNALQDLSHLSSDYYFSLATFIKTMHEAYLEEERPFVSFATGMVPEDLIPEVTNYMLVKMLEQYRPCILQNHTPVLKLLMSLVLLQQNQVCSPAEKAVFLMGLKDISTSAPATESTSESSTALPSWIAPQIHGELYCLEGIPAFKGLTESVSVAPCQWEQYLNRPAATLAEACPCHTHAHLSLIQRALLWKTIHPDRLEELGDALIAHQLCTPGQRVGTDVPFCGNPLGLQRLLLQHDGPIIVMSPVHREDEWTSIPPLRLIQELACCTAETDKVKAISYNGLCDKDFTLSTLDEAARDRRWLVVSDCNFLERWDGKVNARINELVSSVQATVHGIKLKQKFRLWFVSEENATSSLPVEVRLNALPLVCDSAGSVKEELMCSLQQMSIIQKKTLSGRTTDIMELILHSLVFHSVLLQRQKYMCPKKMYHWSLDDLLTLVNAILNIVCHCHDKKKALQYVAVNLVHGGHVLESADLEVMENTAKACFLMLPLVDTGPHLLTKVFSRSDRFDFSELLEVLDKSFSSSSTSDCTMLGIGADAVVEITKIKCQKMNKLLHDTQTFGGITRRSGPELATVLPDYFNTTIRLHALHNSLKQKNCTIVANLGAVFQSPLQDFILAEWNDLIDRVSSHLTELQQLFQYRTLTLASLFKFADLARLERKAQLLGGYLWHENTSDPRGAYRLSAFKNARGFLVAMKRQTAQINRTNVSDVSLHFEVVPEPYPSTFLPDAVFLSGLEIRGATWDKKAGALECTLHPEAAPMPLVCVTAQVKETQVKPGNSRRKQPPSLPVYHCPLYLEERDCGIEGLSDVNIVTTLPLKSKLSPVMCSLKRVRLVSKL
ncbi:dynein heavy chain domain-containing protein 1 isoform X1 [Synchiropus splendidus]|uniref:dynein heavy chain domain-containing protein 1 isoform X1 n=2 Tax=Synchiropus splendidus TaxID=270530 RepID=UPI00237E76D3|nr:dynein heavy chain domain-containing protein 1 isoform X1 [Synchiropus splendidus]XP_053710884.1 dynein heavy chain domain-containing protein 1 isoform X1 [Synchiropus splendidus]XP_053710885.1 dynein heavy chain domain-containing protein 1 isoform X1 [Synchiropus splendidus]XP_053710887.1 dynein heavy chain domain-containing protein 1 isoform X1 [Synchiropus splendidus]